jgi:hypothetical protein
MKMVHHPMQAVSSTVRYILRAACNFFLAFGTLALGYAGFVFADSHANQAPTMRKVKEAGRPSEPQILAEGDLLGEIQAPRVGLAAMVVQVDSRASLRGAVGQPSKSVFPFGIKCAAYIHAVRQIVELCSSDRSCRLEISAMSYLGIRQRNETNS